MLVHRLSGATSKDAFDHIATHDEPLFSRLSFKFTLIKLGKSLLLGDVYLLRFGELELGPG